MKIVIVEDEVRSREGLIHLLEKIDRGYDVVGWAENGWEGLRVIQELQPELIITDIRMPVMDGIAMLQELQQCKSKAKVIVLSAFAEFSYAQQAISFGVDEYLLKPIAVTGLLQALQKVRSALGGSVEKKSISLTTASPIVQRVCRILDSPDGMLLPLHVISQQMKVTPEYLSAQFYRETGCHFSEYSKTKRLEYAKCLLRNTNNRIADISIRCGYQDAKYFSQLFKKAMGMLPMEYRRSEL